MDADFIKQWVIVLDSLSYYEIFGLSAGATHDGIRDAFHAFAETFHPDGHHFRHPTEQANIAHVFRRGTEAYRVLADPLLRSRYDAALAAGDVRPESLLVDIDGPRSKSMAPAGAAGVPARLIDTIKNPGARTFVLRAQELARKGDPQQAKLQVTMAIHLETNNASLQAYARELDDAIRKKAADTKNSWKK